MFSEESRNDPKIRALCRNVKVEVRNETEASNPLASRVSVKLKDGRELVQDTQYFPGMPQQPLTREQLREKFNSVTAAASAAGAGRLFDQLVSVETLGNMRQLG